MRAMMTVHFFLMLLNMSYGFTLFVYLLGVSNDNKGSDGHAHEGKGDANVNEGKYMLGSQHHGKSLLYH